MKSEHGREGGSGRFTWTKDRMCECGHPLSVHAAARTRDRGVVGQPCFAGDFGHDDCDCECFAPSRAPK